MSIKSFFNSIEKNREKKRQYHVLAAAITSGDLKGVQEALANGADAGYMPGAKHKKAPLALALERNDVAIFETLLKSNEGQLASAIWHTDFRTVKYDHNPDFGGVYFAPSYLYAAIEQGKEAIAMLLLTSSMISVTRPGDIYCPVADRFSSSQKVAHLVKTPLELAREKGMTVVVNAIEDRLKPQMAAQAAREADDLSAKAAEKRAEADKLLKEADALQQKSGKAPPARGLNL